MAIRKRLLKLGNSYGLLIDKPILDLLGINVDTLLEITTTNGHSLIIRPIASKEEKEIELQMKFKAALEDVNKEFGPALRNLAKGKGIEEFRPKNKS